MLSKKNLKRRPRASNVVWTSHRDRLAIKGIILSSLLTVLGGCGNSTALESLVSPDPTLKKGETEQVSNKNSPQPVQNSPATTDQSEKPALKDNPGNTENNNNTGNNNSKTQKRVRSEQNNSQQPPAETSISNLLLNFPETFPVYPQAELQEIKSNEDENSGMLIWTTTDNRKAVADYYQAELSTNGWDVIKPFTINSKQKIARVIAVKEDLRVELSLLRGANNQESNGKNTKLSVVYHPLDQDIPKSSIAKWENSSSEKSSQPETPSNSAVDANGAKSPTSQAQSSLEKTQNRVTNKPKSESKIEATNNSYNSSDIDFADLDEVPPQLQQPIESVAALNILTPYTGKANVELTKFAPNEVITRGEYARWLIAANNRYYADNPGKKIYVATKASQPAFNDVKSNHPDFNAIQSLAEAGLIPSLLTEDSTNLLFRPDASLIREDLVTWKVPLDTRKSLPKASIKAIEESWGFQDAADIDSSAARALYADFQNGDRANIRRMFGYTTLFQPKKPVTRAEAAASLWYFGFQGDGVSAKEILESEAEIKS